VEHHQTEVQQVSGRVASADDTERFLRELRELRDSAGLAHAELAARAHYPYDTIKAAEVGPALPDLPVLSAFVRACGGTAEEWEERWRSLTRTPSLPVSEARGTGYSAAAAAGARIGSVSQADGSPDPSLILAALNRVAEGMASGSDGGTPSPADDASSWPDYPPDAASEPTAGGAVSFEPDVPEVPQVPQPEEPASFGPDVPVSFGPDVPVSFEPEVRGNFEPGAPAASVPAPGGMPPGWDPIRVSTAWPAIPDSLIDAALSGEAGVELPPWESAPWIQEPTRAKLGGPGAVPDGWAKAPGAAHATGTAARPARRASAAGSSRTWIWIVSVAVVLLCVLAVVLAIFA
jgi:hypothetical protein